MSVAATTAVAAGWIKRDTWWPFSTTVGFERKTTCRCKRLRHNRLTAGGTRPPGDKDPAVLVDERSLFVFGVVDGAALHVDGGVGGAHLAQELPEPGQPLRCLVGRGHIGHGR